MRSPVRIWLAAPRKKHLRKQVLFSVIFALRRVVLPFGQWYYASHSDIALRQFKANIISLWAKRTIPLLRQAKISRRARLGISPPLYNGKCYCGKVMVTFFTSAQVNRILPRAGLGILLTLLYIINLSIPQLFLYYPAMQHKKTTANFVGCCFLISTP